MHHRRSIYASTLAGLWGVCLALSGPSQAAAHPLNQQAIDQPAMDQQGTNQPAADCQGLADCYQAVLNQADRSRSKGALPNDADQELIRRVTNYGAPALPLLLELLANNNEALARLAVAGLERMPALDAQYLPSLEHALRRDLYVYRVLARMQQHRANALLFEHYVKGKLDDVQLLQGVPLLPMLQQAVACPALCQQHSRNFGDYFARLELLTTELTEPEQVQLLDQLLSNVDDSTVELKVRAANLMMAARLVRDKPVFAAFSARLQASCNREPQLHDSCQQAFVTLRLPQAWRIVAAELQQIDVNAALMGQAGDLLTTLASMGPSAKPAMAQVTRFLRARAAWVRLQAVTTMLAIDPQSAIPVLLQQLHNPQDAQLSYDLVQMLGPMTAESTTPPAPQALSKSLMAKVRQALSAVQTDYWYPPVRVSAKRWLEQPAQAAALLAEQHSLRSFIASEDKTGLSCELAPTRSGTAAGNRIVDVASPDARPLALSYWIEYWAFDPSMPATADVALDTPWTDNPQRVEKRPSIQLRLGSGWLTGRDDGEWGGELMYVDDHGKAQQLANDNIRALVTLGNTQLAIAGLAHMGIRESRIYRITAKASPPLHAERWIELPGYVNEWSLLPGDALLLKTSDDGSFVLKANGSIQMAECR